MVVFVSTEEEERKIEQGVVGCVWAVVPAVVGCREFLASATNSGGCWDGVGDGVWWVGAKAARSGEDCASCKI